MKFYKPSNFSLRERTREMVQEIIFVTFTASWVIDQIILKSFAMLNLCQHRLS